MHIEKKVYETSNRILETFIQRKKKIKKNSNGEYAKSEMLSSKMKQDKNDGMEKRKKEKKYI